MKSEKDAVIIRTTFPVLLLLVLTLAGCGAGRTMVIKAPEKRTKVTSVTVAEIEPTVHVPENVRERFHEQLEGYLFAGPMDKRDSTPLEEWKPDSARLYDNEKQEGDEENTGEAPFVRGSDLTIKYRFIQFDSGSQFTRWFWGGIGNAGEGSLTAKARYYDAGDNELCTIQCEGKIGSGFFGGSFEEALHKAAFEIADYTIKNFK